MKVFLGFDTSNYTTSVAFFDGETGENRGKLLDVPEGTLGLRQSDALFSHVKHLSDVFDDLSGTLKGATTCGVGASTRPRAVEGSYMPCFLAGVSAGKLLAQSHGVPFVEVSHQQGHIAAAAWSAGQMALLDKPHLAWHLSGGTTELLHVTPDGPLVQAEIIGGSNDLSAGQLIDRTGKLLGLSFPAGKALDLLSREAERDEEFAVKHKDLTFSLSGVENKVQGLMQQGGSPGLIGGFVCNTVAAIVERVTKEARRRYPQLAVLFSGGVASNMTLRRRLSSLPDVFFGTPALSADNAMGVAILTSRVISR